MNRLILAFTIRLIFLSGCQSNKNEHQKIATKEPVSEANNNSVNAEEIIEVLKNTDITIPGVYGKLEKGTNTTVRGNEVDYKREFIGKPINIMNLQELEESEDKREISFSANIEGQFFKTISPCTLRATIEIDENNSINISEVGLLDDVLPDITPTIPFDLNYYLSPSGDEATTIRFSITGKEYEANKDLYNIDDSTMEYDAATNGRDAGGTYYITLPLDSEHIKSLEIEYNRGSAIEYEFSTITATLYNGLKIYGTINIKYFPAQRLYPKEYDESSKGFLKNSADYWIFSNDENNWSLDSKRKK